VGSGTFPPRLYDRSEREALGFRAAAARPIRQHRFHFGRLACRTDHFAFALVRLRLDPFQFFAELQGLYANVKALETVHKKTLATSFVEFAKLTKIMLTLPEKLVHPLELVLSEPLAGRQ
jgi:hypothetical protein